MRFIKHGIILIQLEIPTALKLTRSRTYPQDEPREAACITRTNTGDYMCSLEKCSYHILFYQI